MLQISQPQLEQLTLWYLLQHSISSYYKLMAYFGTAQAAIQLGAFTKWQELKLHANHLERLQQYHTTQGQHDFQQLLQKIQTCTDHIVFKGQNHYPETLTPYENSPPILFIRGQLDSLNRPQIAMVGSRQPSPHGTQIAYDFAHYFAEQQYVVTSGLAIGIDAAAHHGAIQTGQSIAVIATGLDQCYPTRHQGLWTQILDTGGAIISEFLPNTPPIKRNFPRRNHIISALSTGTLVVEAGLDSGSLITAKAAAEQGKQVFAIPGHIYSQFHQGCHQLIREGATLVDHPAQVIEDLTMFRQPHLVPSKSAKQQPLTESISSSDAIIPQHLESLYQNLDWIGISIDELAIQLKQNISELNIGLVELELLGLCKQHAGRYLRC